jgi:TRAP-type mannitol/chloroaromatic compound transport system permease small subunit
VRALIRAIETFSTACGFVAAALVFVLMGLMVFEVVMRYVFGAPTIWSYDLSTMTMGAVFVLSIGYTLATGAHVRVDILHPLLPARARPLIDLVGFGLVLLPLTLWLSWELWEYFRGAFATRERAGTSAWNPVVWPFRAIMFVGAAAWTIQTVAEVLKAVLALASRQDATRGGAGEA